MRDAKADLEQISQITDIYEFKDFAVLALVHWIHRAVEAEAKIADLYQQLKERDDALQNESEALGSAEIAAAKLEQENAALKEAITAAYKILMSDCGIYEACRTLREAMERSGEGDER